MRTVPSAGCGRRRPRRPATVESRGAPSAGNSTSPTRSNSAASRANQPTVSKLGASGITPSRRMAPWLGWWPDMPQLPADAWHPRRCRAVHRCTVVMVLAVEAERQPVRDAPAASRAVMADAVCSAGAWLASKSRLPQHQVWPAPSWGPLRHSAALPKARRTPQAGRRRRDGRRRRAGRPLSCPDGSRSGTMVDRRARGVDLVRFAAVRWALQGPERLIQINVLVAGCRYLAVLSLSKRPQHYG